MQRISFSEESGLQKLRESFELAIRNFKTNSGKFDFSAQLSAIDPIDESKVKKPVVLINSIAWLKMVTLVMHNAEEIAWQSCVEVRNFKDSEDTYYYIKDVHVYPQTVTPAHVDMDELEYAKWSMENLTNEQYNSLRFQGHSHVNMGVGPSGTDQATYQKFLDQLQKDEYYIFMILNKRMEMTVIVYDYKQNIIFETKDITIDVLLPEGKYLSVWTKEQDAMLKHPPKVETRPYGYPYVGGYNSGAYNGRSAYQAPVGTPTKKDKVDEKLTTVSMDDDGSIISNVTGLGYNKDGAWHYFSSDIDKIEFFEEHPEFITDYLPAEPHIRDELRYLGVLNRHGKTRQAALTKKKPGKSSKGDKK